MKFEESPYYEPTTFFFYNVEFLRGILTAAQWLNINIHDYIKNIIKWNNAPVKNNHPVERIFSDEIVMDTTRKIILNFS